MTDAIRQSFRDQAAICEAMGAPLTGQVLALLAGLLDHDTAVGRALLDWAGDPAPGAEALALRLAGGLHALVLSGADPELARAYAEGSEPGLAIALTTALRDRGADLLPWLGSPPQTNEVRRSAVLIAAGHWLAARFGLPFILSELGASAGLNLIWDRYALEVAGWRYGPSDAALVLSPEWRGAAPVPPDRIGTPPVIANRAGVDRSPLDPEADRLRLLAYLWAGQQDRIERTRLAAAEATRRGHRIERGDAGDWLESRLQTQHRGHLHLIFHTVVWQYFPPDLQARCEGLLAAAGARATAEAPLAHLAMEGDGQQPGAALRLRIWPGGATVDLGRADFHGRWVDWQAPPPD
ncbi:MAG: DUF2332 domain-containing protein [Pseudorhodobacter sp.]